MSLPGLGHGSVRTALSGNFAPANPERLRLRIGTGDNAVGFGGPPSGSSVATDHYPMGASDGTTRFDNRPENRKRWCNPGRFGTCARERRSMLASVFVLHACPKRIAGPRCSAAPILAGRTATDAPFLLSRCASYRYDAAAGRSPHVAAAWRRGSLAGWRWRERHACGCRGLDGDLPAGLRRLAVGRSTKASAGGWKNGVDDAKR